MSRIALLGLPVALALACAPDSAHAQIAGCWIPESGDAVVEISDDEGRVSGRIVGLEEPLFLEEEGRGTPGAPRTDLNNPDEALRERTMAGLAIVTDLVRDGARWTDGRIYDPQSGNTYAARAEVDDDGVLRLRGYVGSPLFGRTTRWTPASARPEATTRMIGKASRWMPAGAPAPSC